MMAMPQEAAYLAGEESRMLHLTLTGPSAGTYLCLRVVRALGAPVIGVPVDGDSAVHFAYAPDSMVDGPGTCPDCRHAGRCDDDRCLRCYALGYVDDDMEADMVEVENLAPQR